MGWIYAENVKFDFNNESKLKIPNMGWNEVVFKKESKFLKGIFDESRFYFVHSYCVHSTDKTARFSYADYGVRFNAAGQEDNMYGCQFHPEKGGEAGLSIIKSFVARH